MLSVLVWSMILNRDTDLKIVFFNKPLILLYLIFFQGMLFQKGIKTFIFWLRF